MPTRDPAKPATSATSATPATSATSATSTAKVQSHTLRVLCATQVLGGVGVSAGIAAGGLLVADVTAAEGWAGLAQTAGVLGAAVAAVPLAALSNRRGRRPGLALGLTIGSAGAALVVVGGVLALLPVMLLGMLGAGAATASGLQARYAATDLAAPDRVAASLSLVVWATVVGAVAGPNLLAPASRAADAVGLPPLTGPYVLATLALAAGAGVVHALLRPDPLLTERAGRRLVDAPPRPSFRDVRTIITARPDAVLGLVAIAAGHAVMVMVMVMTPVHMQEVDVTLTRIGLVISVHVLGMYAFAPLVGRAADRWTAVRVVQVGVALLLAATAVAGTASGDDVTRLGAGLFLLGLGWSCTLVAGSALVTSAVPDADRPAVQGVSDTGMNIAGALAGGLAGVIVAIGSYGWLNVVAAVLLAPLMAVLVTRRRSRQPA